MSDLQLKKGWKQLYESKKIAPAMAEEDQDKARVNIFNSELYKELYSLQLAGSSLPTNSQMYDICAEVSGITEDRFRAGNDESRVSFSKISEAILSADFFSTIVVNDDGEVDREYSFNLKAIIPCSFLTSKERDCMGYALKGLYVGDYGVLEVKVFDLLTNKVITESKREEFIGYAKRLMLQKVKESFIIECPTVKVKFKYGIWHKIRDLMLEQTLF